MKLGIDLGTSNSSAAFLDRITEELVNVKISTGDEPYDSILRSCALLSDPVKIGSIAESEYIKSPSDANFIDSFKPYLNENQLRNIIITQGKPVIVGYDHHYQQPIWSETERTIHVGSEFSKSELMLGINSFLTDILAKGQNELSNKGEDCDGYLLGTPLNAKTYYRFRLLESLKESSPYSETFASVMQNTAFIPEPVAVSYCFHEQITSKDKKVLIFDYGGGTLDLALLEFNIVDRYVLPTKLVGLSALDKAGKYIDSILKRYLMREYSGYEERYNKLDLSMKYFEDQQIENVKIKLSNQERVNERLVSGIVIDLDQGEFQEILGGLFEDIDTCIEGSLLDAKISAYEQIDKVIMSGGSSLIPAIKHHLADIFGEEKLISPDPSSPESVETTLTAVSRGLAKYDHFIEMTGLQVNKYKLWDQNSGDFITVLGRNDREGEVSYDPKLNGYRAATFVVFYDMIKEEPLICLTSLVYTRGEILKVKIIHDNIYSVFPKVVITNSRGDVVFQKDLSDISESEAKRMIINCDWQFKIGDGVSWMIPPAPLEDGNFIKINNSSSSLMIKKESEQEVECQCYQQCLSQGRPEICESQICNNGSIILRKTGIRDVGTGRFLETTNNWDLSKFAFELIDETTNSEIRQTFKSYEIEIYK